MEQVKQNTVITMEQDEHGVWHETTESLKLRIANVMGFMGTDGITLYEAGSKHGIYETVAFTHKRARRAVEVWHFLNLTTGEHITGEYGWEILEG